MVIIIQLTKKIGIKNKLAQNKLIPKHSIHNPLYIGFLTREYIPSVFKLFSEIFLSIPDLRAPMNHMTIPITLKAPPSILNKKIHTPLTVPTLKKYEKRIIPITVKK